MTGKEFETRGIREVRIIDENKIYGRVRNDVRKLI
jgi:hypothetical protein